jgi:hypothetical protein
LWFDSACTYRPWLFFAVGLTEPVTSTSFGVGAWGFLTGFGGGGT